MRRSRLAIALTSVLVVAFPTTSIAGQFLPPKVIHQSILGSRVASLEFDAAGTLHLATDDGVSTGLVPQYFQVSPTASLLTREHASRSTGAGNTVVLLDGTGTAVLVRNSDSYVETSTRLPNGVWKSTGSSIAHSTGEVSAHRAPDGRIVAIWADGVDVRFAIRTTGLSGVWGASTVSTAGGGTKVAADVVVRPDGTMVACWTRSVDAGGTTTVTLLCADRNVAGAWGSAQSVDSYSYPTATGGITRGPWISLAPSGEIRVAWFRYVSCGFCFGRGSVASALRLPNSSAFQSAQTVTTGSIDFVGRSMLQTNAAGTSIIAFTGLVGSTDSYAFAMAAPGAAFGAPVAIAPAPYDTFGSPVVSSAPLADGSFVIVGRDGTDNFAEVRAAVLSPAGAISTPMQALDFGATAIGRGLPSVAADADGDAAIVMTQRGDSVDNTAQVVVGFLDRTAPVASGISAPTSTASGGAFTASAAVADRFDAAPSVAWSWGDGSGGSGASVSHVYAAPGTYTITATPTDAAGNVGAAVTRSIAVLAPTLSTSGKVSVKRVGKNYVVTTGRALVCPAGGGACSAKVTLTTKVQPKAKRGAKKPKPKIVTIGTASIAAKAGTTAVLTVQLNAAGAAALAKGKVASTARVALFAGPVATSSTTFAFSITKPAGKPVRKPKR